MSPTASQRKGGLSSFSGWCGRRALARGPARGDEELLCLPGRTAGAVGCASCWQRIQGSTLLADAAGSSRAPGQAIAHARRRRARSKRCEEADVDRWQRAFRPSRRAVRVPPKFGGCSVFQNRSDKLWNF